MYDMGGRAYVCYGWPCICMLGVTMYMYAMGGPVYIFIMGGPVYKQASSLTIVYIYRATHSIHKQGHP
jgi:hypothetical protein